VPFAFPLVLNQVDTLYVAGLTTEYCVKQTALDGLRAGLRVIVLTDAIAGIEAHPTGLA
jgi:nicotinamidase/pyrazinamidase